MFASVLRSCKGRPRRWGSQRAVGWDPGPEQLVFSPNNAYPTLPGEDETLAVLGNGARTYSLQWTVGRAAPDPDPDPVPVPEPAVLGLLAVGLLGLLPRRSAIRRR